MTGRTSGGVSESFGYDARGLRVVSQVNGGGTKTFFVFDGETLLGEIDQSGTVQAAYTWGAAGLVSERLVPAGRSLWYAFGPQGEARLLTDGTGTVADTYVYSAYGQPVSSTGSDANPFRYGGQAGYYTDGALTAGAVLCTHRWYDPSQGRWMSRDPSGYGGGDNLYAYCDENPVTSIDENGARHHRHSPAVAGFGQQLVQVAKKAAATEQLKWQETEIRKNGTGYGEGCSGFVDSMVARAGHKPRIRHPRSYSPHSYPLAADWASGNVRGWVKIPNSQAQPGDVIAWFLIRHNGKGGTISSTGHVGIYEGKGTIQEGNTLLGVIPWFGTHPVNVIYYVGDHGDPDKVEDEIPKDDFGNVAGGYVTYHYVGGG